MTTRTVSSGLSRAFARECTVVVTVRTRPMQAQARENPSMEGRGGHGVPPLTDGLLAFNNAHCWEKESQFL